MNSAEIPAPNGSSHNDTENNEEVDELPDLNEEEAEEVIILDSEGKPPADDDDVQDEDGDIDLTGDAGDDEASEMVEKEEEVESKPEKDDAALVLTDHTNETLAVAASPINPAILITGGMDDVGMIWDLELKQCLAKVDGGNDSVSTVSFSHDGKYAAFGSENGALSIVFMDGSEAPDPSALEGPGDTIHFLSWHPRGPVLLAGCADRISYMWNAAKGKFMMAFAGHEDAVTCGSFTSDGKLVVTASNDSSVRIWNPTTGETITRIQTGISGMRNVFHTADIQCLAVGNEQSMGDKLIVTGCAAGDVFVTHRENSQVIAQLPRHEGGVETIAFSPKSITRVYVATGGADGIVRVWDLENSMERCQFSHGGVVSKVIWHKQKQVLASASSDGSVILWDVLKAEKIVRLTGHSSFITDMCFAHDAAFIASTSADGTVRLFNVGEMMEPNG